MNQSWYENFCTCISQDCLQICLNDFWPQWSLNVWKKLLKVRALRYISIYVVIQWETVILEDSNLKSIHDILSKFFLHILHIIVQIFVEMTFNLRGHWMSRKNDQKIDLFWTSFLDMLFEVITLDSCISKTNSNIHTKRLYMYFKGLSLTLQKWPLTYEVFEYTKITIESSTF